MNTSFSNSRSGHRLPTNGGQNAVTWVAAMFGAWRQRHTLDQLDDHMLDDIGVTRHEATLEASKPIWDIPAHWQR